MKIFVMLMGMLHFSLVSLQRVVYNFWMSHLEKGTA